MDSSSLFVDLISSRLGVVGQLFGLEPESDFALGWLNSIATMDYIAEKQNKIIRFRFRQIEQCFTVQFGCKGHPESSLVLSQQDWSRPA